MSPEIFPGDRSQSTSNRIFIKGFVAGFLILLMMIPTVFIYNLVQEREQRRNQVTTEVSSKWASKQTIAPPYLVVNFSENSPFPSGGAVVAVKQLVMMPQTLEAAGSIFPETRSRSIYDILLYRTELNFSGVFQPEWPADIDSSNIDLASAKLCFGLNDFKGIEHEVIAQFGDENVKMRPGSVVNDFHRNSLSAPVHFSSQQLQSGIPFTLKIKLKGSSQLHFLPLAANSSFKLRSTWADPSFDGNHLPAERQVSDSGFNARWSFNQANLGFTTVMRTGSFDFSREGFGVSMVQPADQYNKTERSVKYAILIIGLTFALFFIMELTSNRPFHPVQYLLVGMALVIFYTLLLSISEFLNFDYAYLLSSTATIALITWYAKSHFTIWRSALILCSALTMLYGFIFVLLRLEDTALLVGSIGLFIVLAILMYASRKVNWYGAAR